MLPPMQPAGYAAVQRQFRDASSSFDEYSAVFQDVSDRLMARLDLLAVTPKRVLDLGCRSGYQLSVLAEKFSGAQIVGADPIEQVRKPKRWWRRGTGRPSVLEADPHDLPFNDQEFDLVVSNLLLPWCHDPAKVFREVARVLQTDGVFMFTSAGPDTLQEYRQAWHGIDSAEHVFGLEDMHQAGDAMLAAGFSAPVLDRENILVDYPSIDALQIELKKVGAGNIATGRRSGLMSAGVRKKVRDSVNSGRFLTTLELVHGHGWKGELSKPGKNSNDEFSVSLDSLRRSLRSE